MTMNEMQNIKVGDIVTVLHEAGFGSSYAFKKQGRVVKVYKNFIIVEFYGNANNTTKFRKTDGTSTNNSRFVREIIVS